MTARGLWVGVPVPVSKIPAGNPIAISMPEDAHITLVHLGRTADETKVDEVRRHLAGVWPQQVWVEITGMGFFWRRTEPVKVALINSTELFAARTMIIRNLELWGAEYDKRFGFIPHVTLKEDALTLPNCVPPKMLLPPPLLVWGDSRYSL